jgi:hypothetical protein
MKSNDIAAIILVIAVIAILSKDEDIKKVIEKGGVGLLAYALLTLLAGLKLCPFCAVFAKPLVAVGLAVGFAQWGYPALKGLLTGSGDGDNSAEGRMAVAMCGSDGGVLRWGVTTVSGTRQVTAICKNGAVHTGISLTTRY